MGPSAASTAEDGPLCRPEPLIVTTNVYDDLIPRLQDGTRLIGFKAIPFNSSTFQDDDLEEMLLLVFPTVPSESDTTATPTITSEHKKKLQESHLKLKSEVTMVVSDEIKSMIVRKAQQLKMSIDGEEGHRLVTNWLEILDNWRSDPQDDNFLRVIDCVQIQFDGVTWVARLERKIMDLSTFRLQLSGMTNYVGGRASSQERRSVLPTAAVCGNFSNTTAAFAKR
ncbi:hypothetical protein ACA910_003426 [Epithemia clementina (nom. ined.)]